MSRKKHEEVQNDDLQIIKSKLEDLKENVDILKKIKRRKKKVSKLEQEKNAILKKIAKVEKDKDKKHK